VRTSALIFFPRVLKRYPAQDIFGAGSSARYKESARAAQPSPQGKFPTAPHAASPPRHTLLRHRANRRFAALSLRRNRTNHCSATSLGCRRTPVDPSASLVSVRVQWHVLCRASCHRLPAYAWHVRHTGAGCVCVRHGGVAPPAPTPQHELLAGLPRLVTDEYRRCYHQA
jgi:hypothetical protein